MKIFNFNEVNYTKAILDIPRINEEKEGLFYRLWSIPEGKCYEIKDSQGKITKIEKSEKPTFNWYVLFNDEPDFKKQLAIYLWRDGCAFWIDSSGNIVKEKL